MVVYSSSLPICVNRSKFDHFIIHPLIPTHSISYIHLLWDTFTLPLANSHSYSLLPASSLSGSHLLTLMYVRSSTHSHYSDVTVSVMASQITGVSIVCPTVGSGVHQIKQKYSASRVFVSIWWRHHVRTLAPPTQIIIKYLILTVPSYLITLSLPLSHTSLCISMISGVCVQGMWNAQVKGQVTETHRLKVNSHCGTALFISMYDITMVQP